LDLGLTLSGQLLAVAAILRAASAATTDRPAHGGHRLADVRRYGFLIDAAFALLAATSAAVLTATSVAVLATRRRSGDSGSRWSNRTRRSVGRAGGDRSRSRRAGDYRLRTLALPGVGSVRAR